MGVHTVYNPYLFNFRKKTSAFKNNNSLSANKSDSVSIKNVTLFSEYIPRRKYAYSLIFADNGFAMNNLRANLAGSEIDLEKSRNRTKQLFFKMKMWRYFRE
jgi:hypothetical protein